MKKKKKSKQKIKIKKMRIFLLLAVFIAIILLVVLNQNSNTVKLTKAMETVNTYMSYINETNYSEMYKMLSDSAKNNITEENFINLNEEIYGKLEASNVSLTNMAEEEENRKNKSNLYQPNGNFSWHIDLC